MLTGFVLTGSVPQLQGTPPPGQLEGAPPGAAECVICDCTIKPWLKDVELLLGLGHAQYRSSWAAVTHRYLVCFASALLTHLHIARHSAQGQRTRKKAADRSTAAAQDQLRKLLWDDLLLYFQEEHYGESTLAELERPRVA